jgi:hypothetical protein
MISNPVTGYAQQLYLLAKEGIIKEKQDEANDLCIIV